MSPGVEKVVSRAVAVAIWPLVLILVLYVTFRYHFVEELVSRARGFGDMWRAGKFGG